MLHSSDSNKNFKPIQETSDFLSYYSSFGYKEFYEISKLSEDGFIFPDGSLRFEFFVKKHNYMKRLEIAEAKNADLED